MVAAAQISWPCCRAERRRRRSGAAGMEEGREKRERVDSLGWLTESAVMPKKQRAIEGVGPSSIVELRAQLYRTQEDVKRAKELGVDPDVLRPKKKIDAFLKKNAGVEDRATRFASSLLR